jgi:DNA polymerase III epsilon subunit-like protein
MSARYVAIDTETAGFNAGSGADPVNYPTELAAVAYDPADGSIATLASTPISGCRGIDAWASAHTRHTVASLAKAPNFAAALRGLVAQLRDTDVLVFHHLEFDWNRVLRAHGGDEVAGLERLRRRCTMDGALARALFPEEKGRRFKWPKLEELCAALGEPFDGARVHDAEYDAEAVARCVRAALGRGLSV